MVKRIWKHIVYTFKKPWVHFAANLLLASAAILENLHVQAFCKPVPWALAVSVVCFLPFAVYPISRNRLKGIRPLLFFLFGLASVVCFYCIIFLAHLNILGIPLIFVGIGIVVYVPHVFLAQMLFWTFKNPANSTYRKHFLMAVALSLITFIGIGFAYKSKISEFEKAKTANNYSQIDKNSYLNERIVGMHFIYHTRFNEYDGWRPPMHDPILIAGLWANSFNDPIKIGLEQRVELYKQLYPNKPIKMTCSCASVYSENYFNDPLLN